MIPWWKIAFDEEMAVAAGDAVRNKRMTMGPVTTEFEKRFAEIMGVPHAVSAASGTAALTMALLAAGVGPGDEVVVPNRTWISTAHAPRRLGADVVLADVAPDWPIMTPESFAAAITPRTKAVIPVHLNGRLADMDAINTIAAGCGILVIEDACQSVFSTFPDGSSAGSKSQAGCFSFSMGKPICCGQGGMVTTSDPEFARRLLLVRTHGTADVTMAYWEMLGGNFRLWDVPAAMGLTQLDRFKKRREALADLNRRYQAAANWKHLRLLSRRMADGEVPIYNEALTPRRDELIAFLSERGIQARPYYANINQAPQFAAANPGPYPNADIFAKECLVLPSGPDQDAGDISLVLETLREWEASLS